MWEKVIKGLAAVGGMIAGMFGEWSLLLKLLAGAMVLDYVSGLIVAWVGKSPKSEGGGPSSAAGFAGLAKKAFIIIIVLASTMLDKALNTGAMVFQTATVFYYLANEGLSILENTALMGVPFPKGVKSALEAMKQRGDKPPDEPGNPEA